MTAAASTPAASSATAAGISHSTSYDNGLDLLRIARGYTPRSSSPGATMEAYRSFRDKVRQPVLSTYNILGFLSSGTYGRVYKASLKNLPIGYRHPSGQHSTSSSSIVDDETSGLVFAIKKFKPDKEDHATYTGISQSAMREIALNRELQHENIVQLREVILEEKAIYMVFHYASHDLLQLIHHHSTALRTQISLPVLKSLLFQLLNGVHYLHCHFVLHRDLKPANILLTCDGIVKIADLGLARVYQAPLQSLYSGDKVVVTIWYRAPELLLGARHYNSKIDMWAIGCIWGELLALRPMFKGEEAKMDPKTKTTPFQSDQISRIVEIMGMPNKDRWPDIEFMPDHKHIWSKLRMENFPNVLYSWYEQRANSSSGFDLFDALLQYDPNKRISAKDALMHPWFQENEPLPTINAFASLPNGNTIYPARRLIKDESDPKMVITQVPAQGSGISNINASTGAGGIHYGAGTNTGAGPTAGGGTMAGVHGMMGNGANGSNSLASIAAAAANSMTGGQAHAGLGQPLSSNTFMSAVGPSAPPPAPGSVGSVGPPSSLNSVGPSSSIGQATSHSSATNSGAHNPSNTRNLGGGGGGGSNMVATATANAANAANRQAKRTKHR